MKLYQIDYKKLVVLLLPTFMRKPRLFAFVRALTFSLSELYTQFSENRERNLDQIQLNGQVCYLRKMLNDELDSEKRRIMITDETETGSWVFAFIEGDAYQLLVDRPGITVYSESLIIADTAYFHVSVPWGKEDDNLNNRLRNFLNKYKLLSKKYTISYE